MQPPVYSPDNQNGSAYGGPPSGGAWTPYGGYSGGPGQPSQPAYDALYAEAGMPYTYGGGFPVFPDQGAVPYMQQGLAAAMQVPPHLAPASGISMMEAYRRYLKRAFTFSGYASRAEYWWAYLANVLILGAIYILAAIVVAAQNTAGAEGSLVFDILLVVVGISLILFLLLTIVPNLAVLVRRMHDTGRSGWWCLLGLIPVGGVVLLVFACMESRPDLWRPEWSR